MIRVNGKDIISAYTSGEKVIKIMSNGVQIWPWIDGYNKLSYIQGRSGIWEQSSNTQSVLVAASPRIVLEIPYVQGGMKFSATIIPKVPPVGSSFLIMAMEGSYNGEWHTVNSLNISNQGPGTYTYRDAYCRSNIGEVSVQMNTFRTVHQTVPDDAYDTQTFIGGTEYIDEHGYPKSHLTNPTSVRLTLFSNSVSDGSFHYFYGLKVRDSNNNILYDFVPSLNLTDNEPGLYETVHSTFYGKQIPDNPPRDGVLDFRYGNDV